MEGNCIYCDKPMRMVLDPCDGGGIQFITKYGPLHMDCLVDKVEKLSSYGTGALWMNADTKDVYMHVSTKQPPIQKENDGTDQIKWQNVWV